MEKPIFDVIVLGSGPGGYVAAIRAAQRGLSVALIEARELGGTCLNRGCIPSKTLIANADVVSHVRKAAEFGVEIPDFKINYASMKNRKDHVVSTIRKGLTGLIRSNKIQVFEGYGKFISPNEIKVNGKDQAVLKGSSIIIATGSEPRALPHIPFDYERIHDSTSMLEIKELPKSLSIIGGGVIGCEFASLHHHLGVPIHIFEMLPHIIPMEGKNISTFLEASFKKRGIHIHTNAKIQSIEKHPSSLSIHLEDGQTFQTEQALVCVGRTYNTSNIGIENTGVKLLPNGTIPISESMQTNVPHIYAIGDITGKWLLAHYASHQGLVAADQISGIPSKINERAVPSVIFTDPEIASIGLTLEKALEAGYDATLGKFPFQALGKAQAALATEGFAEVIIDKNSKEILGAQVVGKDAATMIAEMAVAISSELTVDDIGETIHAHPTTSEAWMEAALSAHNLPLHIPPHPKRVSV